MVVVPAKVLPPAIVTAPAPRFSKFPDPLMPSATVIVPVRSKIRVPSLTIGPVPSVPLSAPVPTWSVLAVIVVVPV
jgi:hypothetical protein